MKKKSSIRLLLVIFSIILTSGLLANSASAISSGPFEAIYMVDSQYSTVEKDVFNYTDPSPWVYLKIPEAHAFNLSLTFYTSPTGDDYWTYDLNNTGNEIWISLDSGYYGLSTAIDWVDIVEIGDWNVTAKYAGCIPNCDLYYGSTGFTVVPEPVSSMLFIVGAATLGFRRFRKKSIAA
jgi:hypothetical protein